MNYVFLVRVSIGFIIGVLITATGAVLNAPDDQDLELKHHCEMVQIYRESSGEFGWPDYNNTAHLCTERSND